MVFECAGVSQQRLYTGHYRGGSQHTKLCLKKKLQAKSVYWHTIVPTLAYILQTHESLASTRRVAVYLSIELV